MIFGLTTEECEKQKIQSLIKRCVVKESFAFFPTKMHDGRTMWLDYFYWMEPIYPSDDGTPHYSHIVAMYDSFYYFKEEAKSTPLYRKWVELGWAK